MGAQHGLDAPFVAIDFETANQSRDSACAVALVRVEGRRIVAREYRLIRPPHRYFEFTWLHGISWEMVAREPTFADVWPEVSPILEEAAFLAAHNARFDRSVLETCCCQAGKEPPSLRYECTMAIARRTWNLYPTKLSDVCKHLGIPLQHHDARSDARACARIVLMAREAMATQGSARQAVR